jgi:hypothetical protein
MITYHPAAGAQCAQDGTACSIQSNFPELGQGTAARGADLYARLDEEVDFTGGALDLYESDSLIVAHGR